MTPKLIVDIQIYPQQSLVGMVGASPTADLSVSFLR
jgi:hypothetical protein